MSGINGIFSKDGSIIDPVLLDGMNKATKHRGPDGQYMWNQGSVGFGNCMLRTTPESLNEKLPFYWNKEKLAITADARIDNRKELFDSLKIKKNLTSITDCELIIRSYKKWGKECPKKLLGDFAFTIWDGNQEKIFCARDHMGVKPFYYYQVDDLFIFSSEIKSIFTIPNLDIKINEDYLANYLALFFEDREKTFYENIYRLPAASFMVIANDYVEKGKYWSLDPNYELNLESEQEYANQFLKIFKEAVRCRLRTCSPMGSMLSGGMDSSSIVCTAKHIQGNNSQPFYTFSNVFEDIPESDERYYINSVLSKYDLESYFIPGDDISPLFDWDRVMWHEEVPFLSPNLFLTWAMYSEAKKHLRVLLSGFDGDTTLHRHGPGFLVEYALKNKWIRFSKELNAVSEVYHFHPLKLLLSSVVIPLISKPMIKLRDILNSKQAWEKNKIINPDFANKTQVFQRMRSFEEDSLTLKSSKLHHYHLLSSGMHQDALEELDKASAAFSIETRYPFFDKRLIEFSLALPAEQKLWDGWDRIILRRAMSNILPREVLWRKEKSDLAPVFSRNIRIFGKDHISNILSQDSDLLNKYVNLDKLRKSYESLLNERMVNDPVLWQAICLSYWLKNNNANLG